MSYNTIFRVMKFLLLIDNTAFLAPQRFNVNRWIDKLNEVLLSEVASPEMIEKKMLEL